MLIPFRIQLIIKKVEEKYAIIIVAGGSGKRMNSEVPKQFLLVGGKPVLFYALSRAYDIKPDLIRVVLPLASILEWRRLCLEYDINIPHDVIAGGEERFFSVLNGIRDLDESWIIAIHDGVRPLVTKEMFLQGKEIAKRDGASIPVVPVVDSLRRVTADGGSIPVNRSEYRAVQTPQTFRGDVLLTSYRQPFSKHFTDDASVVEAAGYKVSLFNGSADNIKITEPHDLRIAEELLSSHSCR